MGEGGGQVLRTSLSLAAVTGEPLELRHIRARRDTPGLRAQHLTACHAVAEICDGELSGASIGAKALTLRPGRVRSGRYRFDVGTAGSACLVFQTVLWPLLLRAEGESTVVIEGGTHNDHAPSFDFLQHTFLPLLRALGADVEVRLVRHGFYPVGGGRIEARIAACDRLAPLDLVDAGPVRHVEAVALLSRIPAHVAERELSVVRQGLGIPPARCRVEQVDAYGPGNALTVHVARDGLTETFTAIGRRGVPAEAVARELVVEARRYLAAGVPVGEHLADQLLLPLALTGRGRYRTLAPTLHTCTNRDVVAIWLGLEPTLSADGGTTVVELSG